MTRKDWFWIILILVLLLLVAIISGIFYFNLVVSGLGTGHVVFEGKADLDNSTEQKADIPIIEGDVVFEKIEEDG